MLPPRFRLVLRACLAAVSVWIGASIGLGRIARWAESSYHTYPYHAGEDGLRLLLKTVHGSPPDRTLILGPSAAEGLLPERMEAAWGTPVRLAAISNGTLDDYFLFLSYVEQAHGREALPRRVVLAVNPRIVGNFPRFFGERRDPQLTSYVGNVLNRYSPELRVEDGALGSVLVPKSARDRWAARVRFTINKQAPRYRAGALALLERAVGADPLDIAPIATLPPFPEDPRNLLARANIGVARRFVADAGFGPAARAWLRSYRSPYSSVLLAPADSAGVEGEIGFWLHLDVFSWVPRSEEDLVAFQLGRLAEFTARHGIDLTVVHLDEHPLSRARHIPDHDVQYAALVREHLPGARIVDLRGTLTASEFVDNVHPTFAGAERLTRALLNSLAPQLLSR